MRGALGAIPVIGSGTVELLNHIYGPPLERRKAAFMQMMANAIRELQRRGIDIETLSANEAFVSACVDAGRIAAGEHLEEKLEMLKSALVHQALPHDLPDLVATRFLDFVDDLDARHVRLLRYAQDPSRWFRDLGIEQPSFYSAARRAALDAARIGIPGDVLDFVIEDLAARKLASSDMLGGLVSQASVYGPWITERGALFVDWVTLV